MGLFDLPAPLLGFANGLVLSVLPIWAGPVIWGLAAGTLSMAIYWLLSPQRQLAETAEQSRRAQQELIAYDGNFEGLMRLVRRSLGLSLRRIRLGLLPTIAAAIPVMLSLVWLGREYAYRTPRPGMMVTIRIEPPGVPVGWDSRAHLVSEESGWQIAWPETGRTIRLTDGHGLVLATFPLRAPVPSIQKFAWWNVLFGNPSGYLPDGTEVLSVDVALRRREFLKIGPRWLRGWELIFLASLTIGSLLFRIAFKVR